jgi:hypothetical protein
MPYAEQLDAEYAIACARRKKHGHENGSVPGITALKHAATVSVRGGLFTQKKTVNGYVQWLLKQVSQGMTEDELKTVHASIEYFHWAKTHPKIVEGKKSIWDFEHWHELNDFVRDKNIASVHHDYLARHALINTLRGQTLSSLAAHEEIRIVEDRPDYKLVLSRTMRGEQYVGTMVRSQGCTVERNGGNAAYFYLSQGPLLNVVGQNGQPSFNLHFGMGRYDNTDNKRVTLGHIFKIYPDLPDKIANFFIETEAVPYDVLPFISWKKYAEFAHHGYGRMVAAHFMGASRLVTDRVMCGVKNSRMFIPLRDLNKARIKKRHAHRIVEQGDKTSIHGLPRNKQHALLVAAYPRDLVNIPPADRTAQLYDVALQSWKETCIRKGFITPMPIVPCDKGDALVRDAGIYVDAYGQLSLKEHPHIKVKTDGLPTRDIPIGVVQYIGRTVRRVLTPFV